jgi:hypothetical protein
MDNIIASCSAHTSYLFNNKVMALLPMIHVEIEVVKGRGDRPTEILNFCATPSGMEQLMGSIQAAITSTKEVLDSKPKFMTEQEWFQFLQAHPEDVVIDGKSLPGVGGVPQP